MSIKLHKRTIIEKLENGYVLCKSNCKAFSNLYWLHNPKTRHNYIDLDMRSIPSILKMCEKTTGGDYVLKTND